MIHIQDCGGNYLHNPVEYKITANPYGQFELQPTNIIDQLLNKSYKSLYGEKLYSFLNRLGFLPA